MLKSKCTPKIPSTSVIKYHLLLFIVLFCLKAEFYRISVLCSNFATDIKQQQQQMHVYFISASLADINMRIRVSNELY